MTAGPTPLPPARVAGDGRADALPPRAGLHRGLRAGARPPQGGVRDRRTRCSVRGLRQRGARVGRREPRPARASRPWWPPAASSASAGPSCATPTAPRRSTGRPSGGAGSSPRELDRVLGENAGRRGRVHHLLRDLDRRDQRHPRAGRGRPSPRRADRRRRGLGTRRRCRCRRTSGASTWSWPGRRRRSCPRPASASPARTRRRSKRAAASPGRRFYFDWGRTLTGQRKDPPDSPFTPAVGLVRPSTWRSG